MKFRFPVIIIDEDFRSENSSGLGIRVLAKAIEDEGFEVLTLMQTGKARIIPMVLLDMPKGRYWETWMKFLTEHLFNM